MPFMPVYVDDIIITVTTSISCQALISQLSAKFSMKNLGPLHYFLGIQVQRTADTMFLSQQKYKCDLLTQFSMLDYKPCSTPSSSQKLDNTSGEILSDPSTYWPLIGALQYLIWTRPEIALSINQVYQHMHTPCTPHLSAVKRKLRYLKGTPAYGLLIRKGNLNLTAYSDIDWAGCPIDRGSTTGYCIFFGQNLVS
ncbi:PREDICTED: uncharacterized mitochondrial protein AtMg00810-like [Prunus mume]|uniref:Uncharacterized mitochondrial protein AtMg00810-like n=1 Tax=Prunus mume TaxID=102107 RepID=A0ABM1LHT7_PRUMU|nr:PREDICTED: uncharacterized mitochondrial protein AtMg00810-like [Prunus mume]